MPDMDVQTLNDEQLVNVTGGAYVGPCIVYTIQPGDTLAAIAIKYGTTEQLLIELNAISNRKRLRVGGKILIPAE